jgi:hypothetical protein
LSDLDMSAFAPNSGHRAATQPTDASGQQAT